MEPSHTPKCLSCGTALLLEKSAFLQLNPPPPSAISLPARWRVVSKCNLETLSFMLAQIRKQERKVATVLLLVAAGVLVFWAGQKGKVRWGENPQAQQESDVA